MERNFSNMLLEGFEHLNPEEQQKFLKVTAAAAKEPEKKNDHPTHSKRKSADLSDAELDEVVKQMNF